MRIPLARLAPLAFLAACTAPPDDPPAPGPDPGVDLDALLAAPAEIEIDGQRLVFDAIPWRDFMPGVGEENGSGLIVVARVEDPGEHPLPTGLVIDRIWVVRGTDVWTPAEIEQPPRPWTWRYESVVRDGPRWEPQTVVHVIAQVRDSAGGKWWLHEAESIGTTW